MTETRDEVINGAIEKPQESPAVAAKRLLDQDKEDRAKAFSAAVNAAAQQYRCTMQAFIQVTHDGRIAAQIQVVAGE